VLVSLALNESREYGRYVSRLMLKEE